ncbi:tetratricopeptide repeat protein, partial [Simplicispira lacusdiani]|uniref:tetratricopeptide repeat protein n=1 Tax=Simplicispira lacusdiani TaxID=2213010 RepID=UPI000E717CB3
RGQLRASELLDGQGFARKVEQAYAAMFLAWSGEEGSRAGSPLPAPSRKRRGKPSEAAMNAVVACFNARDYTRGAALARELTQQYPDHGFGWKALGSMLQPLGLEEEAIAAKRRAVALSPEDAEALCNLGHLLQGQGVLPEAETLLLRALALRPDYAEAHNNLGITYQKMGRYDEAEASFRQALKKQPHRAITGNLLFTLNYHPDKSAEEIYAAYEEYEERFG